MRNELKYSGMLQKVEQWERLKKFPINFAIYGTSLLLSISSDANINSPEFSSSH